MGRKSIARGENDIVRSTNNVNGSCTLSSNGQTLNFSFAAGRTLTNLKIYYINYSQSGYNSVTNYTDQSPLNVALNQKMS